MSRRTHARRSGVDRRHAREPLEAQLTLKGLSKTSVSPDVYVLFHMDYDEQKDVSTCSIGPLYGGYGQGWSRVWGWGSAGVRR